MTQSKNTLICPKRIDFNDLTFNHISHFRLFYSHFIGNKNAFFFCIDQCLISNGDSTEDSCEKKINRNESQQDTGKVTTIFDY